MLQVVCASGATRGLPSGAFPGPGRGARRSVHDEVLLAAAAGICSTNVVRSLHRFYVEQRCTFVTGPGTPPWFLWLYIKTVECRISDKHPPTLPLPKHETEVGAGGWWAGGCSVTMNSP